MLWIQSTFKILKGNKMNDIYNKIGYTFKNEKLMERALTHSSYANENKCHDNERLEFFGDSILSVIVSEKLFKMFDSTDEGGLSKMRASLVCEQSLEKIARKIDLGNLIRLGKGEERTGGRKRPSVVSDAFEALIAAIYLDGGMEKAKEWVLNIMDDEISSIRNDNCFGDYKTHLQEILQSKGASNIEYNVLSEDGADHMKKFVVSVICNGKELGRGSGSSKKEAEQNAAKSAVKRIENEAL